MLKVPLTIPKAITKEINFLSRNIIEIDCLNSIGSVIELILAGVGGLYLKKIIVSNAATPAIIA